MWVGGLKERNFTAGSRLGSSYKRKQLRKSPNLFLNRFYLFKVNLFVHGAGRRLDQRYRRSLAEIFLPS